MSARFSLAAASTSRGVTPDDPPGAETVHGLGNRKNELFLKTLRKDGVEVFEGSRRYLEAVSAAGLGTAVVSSSATTATCWKSPASTGSSSSGLTV